MAILDGAVGHLNTVGYIVLMMIGFYAMTGKSNLVKKLVGMNIFQWSIILFVVSLSAKRDASIPIVLDGHGEGAAPALDAIQYVNPLPHVLMLTAIVVGSPSPGSRWPCCSGFTGSSAPSRRTSCWSASTLPPRAPDPA